MRLPSAILVCICVSLVSTGARAGVTGESGGVATLAPPGEHAFVLIDAFGGYVFDGDTGDLLGKLNTSTFTAAVAIDPARDAVYVPGTFYSRLTYGERTDVVVVNDVANLAPVAEIAVPKKIAAVGSRGTVALVGGRFLAVYNMTPAMSVSIVDVESRAFVAEIATPGCALAYAAGGSRFLQVCGDGRVQIVTLDGAGREASRRQSEPFFDVAEDPVYDLAVPSRDGFLFVTFAGRVIEATVTATGVAFAKPWSLLTDEDREEKWRIGGSDPFALNPATGTLLTLMHQGKEDTHEDEGTEIWAFDVKHRLRGYRLKLEEPAYGLEVSADAQALLYVLSTKPRTVLVHDVSTGRHLRTIEEAGYLPRRIQRFR